jgi:hypothetical protein
MTFHRPSRGFTMLLKMDPKRYVTFTEESTRNQTQTVRTNPVACRAWSLVTSLASIARHALTMSRSNGSRIDRCAANSSSCRRSSGRNRNDGASAIASRSSGMPIWTRPSSRNNTSSATTAAGIHAVARPASTALSRRRAVFPSRAGAASAQTQACVSRTRSVTFYSYRSFTALTARRPHNRARTSRRSASVGIGEPANIPRNRPEPAPPPAAVAASRSCSTCAESERCPCRARASRPRLSDAGILTVTAASFGMYSLCITPQPSSIPRRPVRLYRRFRCSLGSTAAAIAATFSS